MLTVERRNKIVELVGNNGKVDVHELSKIFAVSTSTIRRDLNKLDQQRLIQRAHGGAITCVGVAMDMPFRKALKQFSEEKKRIGQLAVQSLKDGETIILDSSTTALELAKNINSIHLTVITNSLPIAVTLINQSNVNIIVTGGDVRRETMTLVGALSEKFFQEITVDKAFLGISAISKEKGMTTGSIIEAELKRKIISAAKEVIGLTDHSKFGKEAFAYVAPVEKLNKIIVDSEIPPEYVEWLKENNVEVLIA